MRGNGQAMMENYFILQDREEFISEFDRALKESELDLKAIDSDKACDDGKTLLVAAGGDGSLNHAVHWLIQRDLSEKIPILYHPRGTGNDFARAMGLSPYDMAQSIELIKAGQAEDLYVGQVNEHLFINMATFGVFAQVTPEVDPTTKNILGSWSYFLKGLETLGQIQPMSCQFEINGRKLDEESILGFFVGNSRYAGGGIQVSPDQTPKSADLDFFLVRDMPFPQMVTLGLEMQKEQPQVDDYNICLEKVERLKFKAPQALQVTLDGESKEIREGEVSIAAKTVKLLLPKQ